jgi:hypothetical protein
LGVRPVLNDALQRFTVSSDTVRATVLGELPGRTAVLRGGESSETRLASARGAEGAALKALSRHVPLSMVSWSERSWQIVDTSVTDGWAHPYTASMTWLGSVLFLPDVSTNCNWFQCVNYLHIACRLSIWQ